MTEKQRLFILTRKIRKAERLARELKNTLLETVYDAQEIGPLQGIVAKSMTEMAEALYSQILACGHVVLETKNAHEAKKTE